MGKNNVRICLPLLLVVVWRRGLGEVEDVAGWGLGGFRKSV